VSHRYSYFSWWWAHSRPKHVEQRNKLTKKNCAPSWLYLKDLIRDKSINRRSSVVVTNGGQELNYRYVWTYSLELFSALQVLSRVSWMLNKIDLLRPSVCKRGTNAELDLGLSINLKLIKTEVRDSYVKTCFRFCSFLQHRPLRICQGDRFSFKGCREKLDKYFMWNSFFHKG